MAGALAELASPLRWEMLGAVTADEAAEYFANLLFNLQSEDCVPLIARRLYFTQPFSESIPNATVTGMDFDLGSWNSDTFSVAAQFAATVLRDGFYTVTTNLQWAANANGQREARISINGVLRSRDRIPANPTTNTLHSLSWSGNLVSNDVVTVDVWQNSGAALDIAGNSDQNNIGILWVNTATS